ncbi:MAG: hypothetical protein ACRD5L_00035, partial [Bryobacteraceae bacterium]
MKQRKIVGVRGSGEPDITARIDGGAGDPGVVASKKRGICRSVYEIARSVEDVERGDLWAGRAIAERVALS